VFDLRFGWGRPENQDETSVFDLRFGWERPELS